MWTLSKAPSVVGKVGEDGGPERDDALSRRIEDQARGRVVEASSDVGAPEHARAPGVEHGYEGVLSAVGGLVVASRARGKVARGRLSRGHGPVAPVDDDVPDTIEPVAPEIRAPDQAAARRVELRHEAVRGVAERAVESAGRRREVGGVSESSDDGVFVRVENEREGAILPTAPQEGRPVEPRSVGRELRDIDVIRSPLGPIVCADRRGEVERLGVSGDN